MRRVFLPAAFMFALLAGCRDESFDARFARERDALDRHGAAIEMAVANEIRAAQEAERAADEAPRGGP